MSSRGTCKAFNNHINETHTAQELTIFWCIVAVNGGAFIISTIQSYRCRNLPSQYNETFYVWITSLIISESLFFSIPVLHLVNEDPSATMVSQSFITTVFALAVLIPMFFPTMLSLRSGFEDDDARQLVRSVSRRPGMPRQHSSSLRASVMKVTNFAMDVALKREPAPSTNTSIHTGTSGARRGSV